MNKVCLFFLIIWLQTMLGVVADEIRTGEVAANSEWIVIGVLGGAAVAFWRSK